jgi:peroxiredoxin
MDFKVAAPAPDFELPDLNGIKHKLSAEKGQIVVLEWFSSECPFVRKHYKTSSSEQSFSMSSTQLKYTKQGVKWFTIASSAVGKPGHLSPAEHQKIVAEWGVKASHFLVDESSKVAALYHAKTTPYMVIVDRQGQVAYAGAIDDRPTTNSSDLPAAKNYVSLALDELLADKPVSTSSTQSYGCSVKY